MTAVIKSSQEIGSILGKGRCIATPFFSLFYQDIEGSGSSEGRVAYIAGKKNGNAVWRNRAKRKLRAAWALADDLPTSYDVLLIANRRTADRSAVELAKTLDDVLLREGLLQ